MNIDFQIKNCLNENLQSELIKIKKNKKTQVSFMSDFIKPKKIAIVVGSEVNHIKLKEALELIIANYTGYLNQDDYDEIVNSGNRIMTGGSSVKAYTHYWRAPKMKDNDISHLAVHPFIYVRDSYNEIKIRNWIHQITAKTIIVSADWKKGGALAGHDRSDRMLQYGTDNIFIFRNSNSELNVSEGIDYIQHSANIINKTVTVFNINCEQVNNSIKNVPFGIEQNTYIPKCRKIVKEISNTNIRSAIKLITKEDITTNKKKVKNVLLLTKAKKKKISAQEEMKHIETKMKNITM
jgi:hypothetical protein